MAREHRLYAKQCTEYCRYRERHVWDFACEKRHTPAQTDLQVHRRMGTVYNADGVRKLIAQALRETANDLAEKDDGTFKFRQAILFMRRRAEQAEQGDWFPG